MADPQETPDNQEWSNEPSPATNTGALSSWGEEEYKAIGSPKMSVPASVPGVASVNGIPKGYSLYKLKNGKTTIERDADKAIFLHPGVGAEGSPNWYYGQNAGEKYKQPAPSNLSMTFKDAPRIQPWVSPNTGKMYFQDQVDGSVYSDQPKNGNPAGWYMPNGTYVPPEKKKPFEEESRLGGRPGISQGQDTTPASIGEKIKAVGKEAYARTLGLISGGLNAIETAARTTQENERQLAYAKGEVSSPFPEEERPEGMAQYTHEMAEKAMPREAARTMASKMAGMAPIVGGFMVAPEAAGPALAIASAGDAQRDVQNLRDQGVYVSPGSDAAYTALNSGLMLVPLGGGKVVSALGKNALVHMAAETGLSAVHMGALGGIPTAFRNEVWNTGEDWKQAFAESAKLGLGISAMGVAAKNVARAKVTPTVKTTPEPASPESIHAALLNLPEGGVTPLDFAKANGISTSDARDFLHTANANTDHPVTQLPNGKFGHTPESVGNYLNAELRRAGQPPLPTPPEPAPVGQVLTKGETNAIQEQGATALHGGAQEGAGGEGRQHEGVGAGVEGQEITRENQAQEAQVNPKDKLREILSGPNKPEHALVVLGPSGSGRTTEATAALEHMPNAIALDGTTKSPKDLRSQIDMLRGSGVEPSFLLAHPSIPDIISRSIELGKVLNPVALAHEIYGSESPLNQFIKAGNDAKLKGLEPGMALKMGDEIVEGDAALSRARSMAETLNRIGPERGAERIADQIAKQLEGGKYDQNYIKQVLSTFPASRQALASDLSARLGIKYQPPKPMGTEPVGIGGQAPGEAGANATGQAGPGAPEAVPGRVWNSGPEAVQATGAEAPTLPQAAGVGQNQAIPGSEATGGAGPQAGAQTQAAQVPGEQPATKQSFTLNGIEVPLMTPEHQARLAIAEQKFKDAEQNIAKLKTVAPTEEEDPDGYKQAKDDRRDMHMEAKKQLAIEKREIAREVFKAQAEANPEMTKEQILKFKEGLNRGAPEYPMADQAISTLAENINMNDKQAARTAILYGDTNFEDFKQTLKEQMGDRFNEGESRKWFDELSSRLDPSKIMPRMDNPKSPEDFDLAVADMLNASSAMIPGKDGSFPTLAPDNYKAMVGESVPQPTRDLNKAEMNYPGSRGPIVTGLLAGGKDAVFKPGQHYLIDLAKAANMKMNYIRENTDWAKGTLKDVTRATDRIETLNKDLKQEYERNLLEAAPLVREGLENQKDAYTYANWKRTENGQRIVELHNRNQEIFSQINQNTLQMIPKSSDVRIFAYLDNKEGSPLHEAAVQNMSTTELETAEKIKQYYEYTKSELDKRGIRTFDTGTAYANHVFGAMSDPEVMEQLRAQNFGGRKLKGEVGDTQQLPDMNFGSRNPNAPAFMPSITEALGAYIPSVGKKLSMEPVIQKWAPSVESNFNGEAPRLADMMADHFNKMNYQPNDGNNVFVRGLNSAIDKWKSLAYLRMVGLSPSVAFKHTMKMGLELSNLGAGPILNAAFQKAVPDAMLDSPLVQKGMKALGMSDVVDPSVRKAIATTLVQTRAINAEIEGLGLNDSDFNAAMTKMQKAGQSIKSVAGSPTSNIERYEVGLNALATHIAGKQAGLSAAETVKQMIQSNQDTNFNGVIDSPRYINPSKSALANKALGTMTMFSSTPLKITEQYLHYIMQPNAVDAFGTTNGVKVARTILWLGTLAAIGDVTHKKVLGTALHPPFYSPEEGFRTPPGAGDLESVASMLSNLSPENLGAKAIKIGMPTAVSKAINLASGELPEGYGGPASYVIGLKEQEEGPSKNEKFKQKAEAKENRSARKTINRLGQKIENIPGNLKQMFSSKETPHD